MFHVSSPGETTVVCHTEEAAMKAHAAFGFIGKITTQRGIDVAAAAEAEKIAAATELTDKQKLEAMGFEFPELALYNHTDLGDMRASRSDWDAQPLVEDSLGKVFEAVKAEERGDLTVRVRDLRMNDEGRINIGGETLGMEYRPLTALLSRCGVFPRGASLMAALDPDVRAYVFQKQIAKADPTKRVRLRTRAGSRGRNIFAAVSPSYNALDADMFALLLADALQGTEARGEAHYNPASTSFLLDATFHKDVTVDTKAGDVFKVGTRFRSNDAGGGAIKGGGTAFRPQCLNMSMIDTAETELFWFSHSGKLADLGERIVEAVAKAHTDMAAFAEGWGFLRNTDAKTALGGETVEERLGMIADMANVDDVIKRDALVEVLLAGFAEEPGDSVADLLNAVTRAHTQTAVDAMALERLEIASGRLVPILVNLVGEA